jgi:hypothetical protein
LTAAEAGNASCREGHDLEAWNVRLIDVTPLHRALQLEHLGLLPVTAQDTLGMNDGTAVKLIW